MRSRQQAAVWHQVLTCGASCACVLLLGGLAAPAAAQVATASIQVTIHPESVRGQARWRLANGPDTNWKRSDQTVRALPLGQYQLEFNAVTPWTTPAARTVTLDNGPNSFSDTYTKDTYTVTIETTPGGTTTPSPGVYQVPAEQAIWIAGVPEPGYEFVGWVGIERNDNHFFQATRDTQLVALFAEPNSFDCNGNGEQDAADILNGFSRDCDANGVPDECQPDSDNDGTIDACEPVPGETDDAAAADGGDDAGNAGQDAPAAVGACPVVALVLLAVPLVAWSRR